MTAFTVKKRKSHLGRRSGLEPSAARKASWRAGVSQIGATSFRILRAEGAHALAAKAVEKIRKTEFRILEAPATPVRRRRYSSSRSARGGNIFRVVYEDMLSVAVDRAPPKSQDFGDSSEDAADNVKLIAFYLPQFHPTPENDKWWGRGFTEWTNVSRAVPQFLGHYQPRLPGELGFYDLRVPEIQRRQVELARQYGIHGFCVYYYWFDGRRLLERPLDQYLSKPDLDLPFCLCWVNQNWTRCWDGGDNQILMAQTYPAGWHLRFIADIEPIFRDRRYIRINGKPLLVVYNPQKIPSAKSVLADWRSYCQARGEEDLHLVGAQTFGFNDPTAFGFDAAVEFPPHIPEGARAAEITDQMRLLNPSFGGRIYDYWEVVEKQLSRRDNPDFDLFRGVMTGWDNEPRRVGKGIVYAFSTPRLYADWLRYACDRTISSMPVQERLVFINAWNEWGEGAYLEPDQNFGYGYLEATRAVLRSLKTRGKL